jgi:hypothetical protein
MDPEVERCLAGLRAATEFAITYRFEMTDEYRSLIAQTEALPQNQSGADKSGRWRGSRRHAQALIARATLLPRTP